MRSLSISLCLLSLVSAAAQLPYQGRLDRGGKPLTGTYDFQFTLYSGATGGGQLWADTFASVPVVAGAFSVKLGSGAALDPSVFAAPSVFVSIAVRGPGETSFTTLAGRQQVLTTPYATQSQQDFLVPGKLAVDAGVTITGTPSNGTTAPLQVVSATNRLIADGQSIDSNGTLQLQTKTGLGTQVGGTLAVTGQLNANGGINAPNIWTKVYDNGSYTQLGSLTFNVKTDGTYKIVIDGYWYSNSAGGNIVLRANGISSGYKSWLRSDGDFGGWFSDTSGVILSWNSNLVASSIAVDETVALNSAFGNTITMVATGSHTEMELSSHATYIGISGGSLALSSAVTQLSVTSTTSGISAVHVMVFTTTP